MDDIFEAIMCNGGIMREVLLNVKDVSLIKEWVIALNAHDVDFLMAKERTNVMYKIKV